MERRDDVTVVRLETDHLDADTSGDVRVFLMRLVQGGHHKLVLDLGGVAFIDSAGLGVLVAVLKRLRSMRERRAAPRPGGSRRAAVRGDLRLAEVQPCVTSLLEIIRLDRVFSVSATVAEAVESYRPRS